MGTWADSCHRLCLGHAQEQRAPKVLSGYYVAASLLAVLLQVVLLALALALLLLLIPVAVLS